MSPKRCVMLWSAIVLLIFSSDLSAQTGQQYGIKGNPAPELSNVQWLNGKGKPVDPIRLSDLKGKVIYLLFFQDW